MIKSNRHKYSVSAMCLVLQVPRSTYYYESQAKATKDEVTPKIIEIFEPAEIITALEK